MTPQSKLDVTLVQRFLVNRPKRTVTTATAARATVAGGSGREHEADRLPVEGEVVGGHYRLVSRLGEGMFGRVYLAERTDVPEHRVALKVVARVMYAGRNVERELVMLAAATHPNIVQLKDHGLTDDYVWLTMPLYEGETLASRLERGPLGLREAYEIFLPITRGVQALHERGLRHQDIKPENIFLARFSERLHPVLLDLGVAVEHNAAFVAGTVMYCSPEQVLALGGVPGAATLTERMDTYCLATTLLRSLLGEHFDGEQPSTPYQLATMFARREVEPLPPEALPELTGEPRRLLGEALCGWLKRDAAERASAERMARELDVLLEPDREAAAAIERTFARQRASLQRVRLALAAMAMLGVGAGLWGYSKRETIKLAGELERARAEGARSFDKLDTCVGAHGLALRDADRCALERKLDKSAYDRQLDLVVDAQTKLYVGVTQRLDTARGKLRSCEDDARTSAESWAKDKGEIESELERRSTSFKTERTKLVGERDDARRAQSSCEGALASVAGTRDECRGDLASCVERRDACLATTAPVAPAPANGGPATPAEPAGPSAPGTTPAAGGPSEAASPPRSGSTAAATLAAGRAADPSRMASTP